MYGFIENNINLTDKRNIRNPKQYEISKDLLDCMNVFDRYIIMYFLNIIGITDLLNEKNILTLNKAFITSELIYSKY